MNCFNLRFILIAVHDLRDVCIRMESKHFRCVRVVEGVNVVHILNQFITLWYWVALVEKEILSKHLFPEPNLAECVQQTFVKVVCNTAAILDFTKHVPHTCPVNPLKTENTTVVMLKNLMFNVPVVHTGVFYFYSMSSLMFNVLHVVVHNNCHVLFTNDSSYHHQMQYRKQINQTVQ